MVRSKEETTFNPINHPLSDKASMAVLVGEQEGWQDYVMRLVSVEVGGFTPKHEHPWPHINYMVEGEGILMIDGVDYPVKKGSHAYVPGNTLHQFKNTSNSPFKFICIVPKEGHQ
jgi:quercetin dioxygenase-like cupin family protein